MSVEISVIIVNWRTAQCLPACLRTLREHSAGLAYEVIVLDGGSFDGCGEMLKRDFPEVKFIQWPENVGFARGNNIAARQARGRLLLFLNPDTEWPGPGLRRMYEAAQSLPQVGALAPRLLNADGTLQDSCIQAFPSLLNQLADAGLLRNLWPRARLWGTRALYDQQTEPAAVEGLSGACLMTPRAVFEDLGGFCEAYFMYFEDMDYCLRVQRRGLRNYYVPRAVVIHHGGQSSGQAPSAFAGVMMAESGWRYFRLRRGVTRAVLYRLGCAVKAATRLGLLGLLGLCVRAEARRSTVRAALRKWAAVFRWSLGGERWAVRYAGTGAAT